MNAKNLPFQVGSELIEISDFLKKTIETSSLELDLQPIDGFGFSITHKKYKELKFSITEYVIIKREVIYSTIVIPLDERTSIDSSEKQEIELAKSEVFERFIHWTELVENYEKFAPIDFTSLFKLKEDDPFFLNSPDVFTEKDKILTYCLKSLSVSNFQGIKRATIENIPIDCKWVFLVGENGFGKSTILQSILLGLHGSKDGAYDYVLEYGPRIKVEYKNNGDNLINDYKSNLFPLPHLAAYGPVRLNLQGDTSASEVAEKSGTLYSLFRTNGLLLDIEKELLLWKLKNDNRFNLAKRAFLKLVPYLADIQLNPLSDRIEYIEKDTIESGSQYEPLPFEKIASGFRSILGIAGDMIIRLSNTQKGVENPSDLKGIVIIDELDLHWHPKLQKQIPELFSEVFPNIQFIVSTHSPIPLLGAPKNSVILKVNRTKEEGITVQKVDIDLKTLTPNLLLTSGVFDMDDIFSTQLEDLTDVRTEDTFEEMEKNDEIDQYLENFEKSNQQFPDELFEPKSK